MLRVLGNRSLGPLDQNPTLGLIEATPNAVWLTDLDGVLKAVASDFTLGTNCLSSTLPLKTFVLALELRRREEHSRLRTPTFRFRLPRMWRKL